MRAPVTSALPMLITRSASRVARPRALAAIAQKPTQLRHSSSELRPFLLEQLPEWHACKVQLSNSDSEPLQLAEMLAIAEATGDVDGLERWSNLTLGYPTHSQGAPWLIEEVCGLYEGVPGESVVTCVPQEGIFMAVSAILGEGAGGSQREPYHVVSMHPCYQSLMEVARSTGATVDSWTAKEDDLSFDVDELEAALRPDTRLIVLNLPHNPTGSSLTRAQFLRVVELARARGAYLFVDEMYRGLSHADFSDETAMGAWPGPAALPSVVEAYPERGVALCGMSKAFGMPGIRLGWIATHCEATMARMRVLKDYLSICPPTPSEVLAVMGLRAKETILRRNRKVTREGKAAIKAFVEARPESMEWAEAEGGTTLFPKLVGGVSSEAYCDYLSKEGSLMLIAASKFRFGDERVRFGCGRSDVPAGLGALAEIHDAAVAAARVR